MTVSSIFDGQRDCVDAKKEKDGEKYMWCENGRGEGEENDGEE